MQYLLQVDQFSIASEVSLPSSTRPRFTVESLTLTGYLRENRISLVSIAWLHACFASNSRVDETPYLAYDTENLGDQSNSQCRLATDESTVLENASVSSGASLRQRQDQSSLFDPLPISPHMDMSEQLENSDDSDIDDTATARSTVYVDDSTHTIYDAMLSRVDVAADLNKFKHLQLLDLGGSEGYRTTSRSGRVGQQGRTLWYGDRSLGDARQHFERMFTAATGLTWASRDERPLNRRYTFVQQNYRRLSRSDIIAPNDDGAEQGSALTRLSIRVQTLITIIYELPRLELPSTHSSSLHLMPFGKLSRSTLYEGYNVWV